MVPLSLSVLILASPAAPAGLRTAAVRADPVAAVAASPIPLHPLLVGVLSEPGNPVVARMAAEARHLASLRVASRVRLDVLEARLLDLADPASPAVDRVAAGALARAAAEPEVLGRVLAASPAAADSLSLLPSLASPSSPYREAPPPLGSALHRLAAWARREPAVSRLFDSSPRPDTGLDGLAWTGNALLRPDGRAYVSRLLVGAYRLEHPWLPGAALEVEREGLPVDEPDGEWPREEAYRRLSEAGLSPRLLASDVLFRPRVTAPRPMHRVMIQERFISGASMGTLGILGELPEGAEDLLLEFAGRAAEAGLDPARAPVGLLEVGTTPTRPAPRVWLAARDPERLGPSSKGRGALLAEWDESIRLFLRRIREAR